MSLMQLCKNSIVTQFQTELVKNVMLVLDESSFLGRIEVTEVSDDKLKLLFKIAITCRPEYDCIDGDDGMDIFFSTSNLVSKAVQQLNTSERPISVAFKLGDSVKDGDGEYVFYNSDFIVTIDLPLAFTHNNNAGG